VPEWIDQGLELVKDVARIGAEVPSRSPSPEQHHALDMFARSMPRLLRHKTSRMPRPRTRLRATRGR
jgi:hypothetical protein